MARTKKPRKVNIRNIQPTKAKYEKAKAGLEKAFKAGKIKTQAQFDGMLKGLQTRYKDVM